ncbi:MAG: hypothetical protein R2774_12900 [Saprospiraceae bacterium]
MTKVLWILFGFFIASCDRDYDVNTTSLECDTAMIMHQNMVPYNGIDTYCVSLIKYVLDGKAYYVLDNCTADMLSMPVDCDNIVYITNNGKIDGEVIISKEEYFFKNAINLGVIGILY